MSETVRVRLGRHLVAPHGPSRIRLPDARALYAKVTSEVLDRERQVGLRSQENTRYGSRILVDGMPHHA